MLRLKQSQHFCFIVAKTIESLFKSYLFCYNKVSNKIWGVLMNISIKKIGALVLFMFSIFILTGCKFITSQETITSIE